MTYEDNNLGAESPDSADRWTPETDPDGYSFKDIRSKDVYLDIVLNFIHGMSDEHPGSIGLTVTSNGAVVSGIAISRAEWITGVVDQHKSAGAQEIATYLNQLFTDMHSNVVEKAKSRDEADLPTFSRKFLHMKDARLGSGDSYTQVPLWRGALIDITGWSLGSWNPRQEN